MFEREVLSEVSALMVPPEQEQRGCMVNLQDPEKQHTLQEETLTENQAGIGEYVSDCVAGKSNQRNGSTYS